jgi:arylsulfatase A-like enzyme
LTLPEAAGTFWTGDDLTIRACRRLALATAATILLAAGPGCAPPPDPKPNILLISIDTLRADHLATYGYDRPTSPFVDSLAAQGIRFDRAYATSSWTTPSVVSMITSSYPTRHRMGGRIRGVPRVWSRIPDGLPNLAEALRLRGYRTFGLVANTNLAADRGFDRGFDRFECLGTADLDRVDEAIAPWLDEIGRGEGPWFFWLHMLDPHGPYNGRTPWIESFEPAHASHAWLDGMTSERLVKYADRFSERHMDVVRALYDSEIRDMDEFLRSLFDRMPGAEDAFVLFTADHGEEFLDHGGMLHGRTLFDEQVRIPFIVRLPEGRFAGTVVDDAVSLVDVLPTIIGAAGGEPAEGAAGIDLIGPDGPSVPDGRVVVAELLRGVPERATIDGRWKFISKPGSPDRLELYDLNGDPSERANLAGDLTDRVAHFQELLAAFERAHTPVTEELEQTDITPEQLEALRALGYVAPE